MILNKRIGYNHLTRQYINPSTGLVDNLPSADFVVADSVLADYEDFGTLPENWFRYASALVGSAVGFKDYQALRAEIRTLIEAIAGVDYSLWDNLTNEQKVIALRFVPTKIIDNRGFAFYDTTVSSLISGETSLSIINYHLDISETSRKQRYGAMSKWAYQYLGRTQGLKAELYARQAFVEVMYKERGLLYKAEDNLDGFGDWILSNVGTSFETTGLKARINNGEFVLVGIDVDTFCSRLIEIVENGVY